MSAQSHLGGSRTITIDKLTATEMTVELRVHGFPAGEKAAGGATLSFCCEGHLKEGSVCPDWGEEGGRGAISVRGILETADFLVCLARIGKEAELLLKSTEHADYNPHQFHKWLADEDG